MSIEKLVHKFLDECPELEAEGAVSFDITSSRAEVRRNSDRVVIERKTSSSIHYAEITAGARSARLDYPLLAALTAENGNQVDIPLPGTGVPALPDRYHYQRLFLPRPVPGPPDCDPDLRAVKIEVANPEWREGGGEVERILHYELGTPFGYEDLVAVVADALLLAGPSDWGQCVGPHGRRFDGPDVPLDDGVADALTVNFPLCQECLDLLGRIGLPLAPSRPKEWA